MRLFWLVTAAIILIPIAILAIAKPYETKTQDLDAIEVER